ncbi:V-type ATP synthase subunit F [Methanocella sp. CWC-04]|uniref:A-type ATP synthase subunit F n=1 Tax=Methanooceanicella nereidis TaxID=2052831 RepID=A0AAP2W735_9EURY|nr:V-type ATP synthase subunit F [Methanocella sp. CWC-04]MCD1295993.1 V-type ATP synthase subunit F [Methanocella sp. CWC-04]
MEIAVVGKSDFVVGFRLAGVRKTFDVKSDSELEETIRKCLDSPDIGIIVLHTDDVRKLPVSLQKVVDESVEPTFIAIGGKEESGLREKIKRAIGVDLWK